MPRYSQKSSSRLCGMIDYIPQAGHSLLVRKHFSFAGLPDQIAERATECLWREQYILRHLSHENIVKFMGFHMNEEKEEAMIYMEYWGIML